MRTLQEHIITNAQSHDGFLYEKDLQVEPSIHFYDSLASGTQPCSASAANASASGLWNRLPEALILVILHQCMPTQLAKLQATCTYFHTSSLIDSIAKHALGRVPRAKDLHPCRGKNETYLALLQFVNRQSVAAAQATAVACGGHHTLALLADRGSTVHTPPAHHELFTSGRNFHGQLGTGSFEDHSTLTPVSLGSRPCQDDPCREEEPCPTIVACGAHHSACISRDGELFLWGLGRSGQLGQGRWGRLELPVPRQCQPRLRVVAVACGTGHTLAAAESGALWSCGSNSSGQLGQGGLVDSSRMVPVQSLTGTRVASVAAGAAHSVALASDGSVYTWGDGSRGQLGHQRLQAIAVPCIQNTVQNAVMLLLPQQLPCLTPTTLHPENRVASIAAGSHHTLVLTVGGGVLAFGANDAGCLGLGDRMDRWRPTPVDLALQGEGGVCVRAVQLACGAGHSIALISKQGHLEVRTTGSNCWGQLGLGDFRSRSRFTPTLRMAHVVAVQAGDQHCAARTQEGDLFVWGRGDSGQLGLGDLRGRCGPTWVKGSAVTQPKDALSCSTSSARRLPHTGPVDGAQRSGKDDLSPHCLELYHFP